MYPSSPNVLLKDSKDWMGKKFINWHIQLFGWNDFIIRLSPCLWYYILWFLKSFGIVFRDVAWAWFYIKIKEDWKKYNFWNWFTCSARATIQCRIYYAIHLFLFLIHLFGIHSAWQVYRQFLIEPWDLHKLTCQSLVNISHCVRILIDRKMFIFFPF